MSTAKSERSKPRTPVPLAIEAAAPIDGETESVKLGARDREVFVQALRNPEPPNTNLKDAARWYRTRARSDRAS